MVHFIHRPEEVRDSLLEAFWFSTECAEKADDDSTDRAYHTGRARLLSAMLQWMFELNFTDAIGWIFERKGYDPTDPSTRRVEKSEDTDQPGPRECPSE